MTGEAVIRDVSDTAFWVAHYRAMETQRPDALFHDPLAATLAGERGAQIVASLPQGKAAAWALITRTAVLDRLIVKLLGDGGFDTVINLAAGLDTRPFRLPLHPDVRWIEVDLPDLMAHKRQILQGRTPRCCLEMRDANLADDAERQGVLADIGATSKQALVLTEGLLMYLPATAVGALARDLGAVPSIHSWLLDLVSPAGIARIARLWRQDLANAPWLFGTDSAAFFAPFGWQEVRWRPMLDEAANFGRLPWFIRGSRAVMKHLLPATVLRGIERESGVLHLQRS